MVSGARAADFHSLNSPVIEYVQFSLLVTFKFGVSRCKKGCGLGVSYLWTASTLQNMLGFGFTINENGNVLVGSDRCC